MLKKILGAVLTLGVVFGGVAVAAPAQADTGTSVSFRYLGGGLPTTTKIWFKRVNGTSGTIGFNGLKADVKTVCPYTGGQRLFWYDPRGNYYELNDGQCTNVSLQGTYRFGVA